MKCEMCNDERSVEELWGHLRLQRGPKDMSMYVLCPICIELIDGLIRLRREAVKN